MLRGHATYLSLFSETIPSAKIKSEKKGRSKLHHHNRNIFLAHRYYYHAKIRGNNYHSTLQNLEDETFLCQRTITDAIDDVRFVLTELNALKPDVNYFKRKYPYFVWL